MKLNEIVKRPLVIEGVVEPNLMMSIQNIIKRGRADNHFEFMCVARLLQLLKRGDFYKNANPLFDSGLATSKEVLDHLRALPPAEMTAIALRLWDVLQVKNADSLAHFANPTQEYLEWLTLFTAREAND